MDAAETDTELLRRYARDGAEPAFAEIVRRYVALVYHAAARQLGDDVHAAEDVTQRVFTLLARKAGSVTAHTSLAGWLHATTRFVARETIRAERRRRRREQQAAFMQQLAPNTEADLRGLRAVLDDAIAELNERDREAVLLRFFVGLRLAELGGRLGLSENSARMRVERALERLQRSLQRRGVTSTAGALALALGNQAAAAIPAGLAHSVTTAALTAPAPMVGAAFFASMSTSTLKIGAAAAVALAAVGLATREIHAQRARAAEVTITQADLQRERERWRLAAKRANAAEAELTAAIRQSVITPPPTASATATTDATVPQSTAPAEPWDPREQGRAFLGRHPEVRDRFVAWTNAQTDFEYGRLYVQLGLSPAQIDEFRAVMLDRSTYAPGVGTTGRQLDLSLGDTSTAEMNERLKQLLGPLGFESYQTYKQTLPARRVATNVAAALCFTAEPLTTPQAEALVQVAAATRQSPGANRRGVDWQQLLADAAGLLTPNQIAVLQREAEQQRLMLAVDAAIATATANPKPTGSSTPMP